ncbi:hypothetical protein AUEXF2481DRAFT_1655 [Aureobasidium subglaciale EXF-2481]|uniref:Rhodopsin domain-containing protein n=1 Tax=Aureobasidium subglaciale (strain EXF-2481) TaxID=1043005 RepID=A0A074YLX4_AURSE|nr:uncharacterized protein AUEXF2481DRAFT_1655 [Aureobasidium subglaciale EXF-2481]KEQ98823.1 hypothetical protein AUEXF2481DRAFT_1655 [Aureobasidium subglaciale EXF-2481]
MVEWGGREGTKQVVIVFVFLALALIVLSLRLFTRVIVTRNHGLEDWVIAAAFCFSVAQASLVLVEVQHGQGLPQSDLSQDELIGLRKTLWKAIPTYLAGLTLTKLSILLQYMRIFKDRLIRRIIIGMLVFVAFFGVWAILGSFFLCTPVHYFWDRVGEAKCMNLKAKWFVDAAVNIITDLIILSMPMPYLKGLNLPKRQRVGLIVVFALGGFVCLVSMARLGPLYVISNTQDVSKHNGPAAFLSSMEVNVGIICASLPSLRAITLRTCSRRSSHPQPERTNHAGWWQFDKRNDNIELEEGHRQNESGSGSAITKVVSIKMDTQERRESGRKLSIWSTHNGGIFDGGAAKAWIRSGE